MRKAYLLFTLLMIGLASCKPKQNDKPTTYAVGNVHDIELGQGGQYYYDLDVAYLGPVQENVILEMVGLPEGITAHFSKTGGIPPFQSRVTLRNNSAEPGLYAVSLKTTGKQTGEKNYDFNINVVTEPLCGTLGTYTYTMVCDPTIVNPSTSETITAAQTPVENTVNPVRFENFGRRGWVVTGEINCSNNTIKIPLQPVGGGMEISGTGTFTSTGMNVSYTLYSSGGSGQVCNFTLLRSN